MRKLGYNITASPSNETGSRPAAGMAIMVKAPKACTPLTPKTPELATLFACGRAHMATASVGSTTAILCVSMCGWASED
eukprot:7767230-Alexandrium_andersonii.AAC.1